MPRLTGEPWAECSICGFEFPQGELRPHYRTKRLVDGACQDQPAWSDYMAYRDQQRDGQQTSLQPVSGQGPSGISSGYGTKPYGEFPYGDQV